ELLVQHKIRSAFLAVFAGTGEQGALVLATIGKKCGIEQVEAGGIDPSLTAFWNWIMVMLGIRGTDPNENIAKADHYQNYIQEMRALLPLANMNDVTQELSQIGGTDGGSSDTGG